jgi:hypothetical protein
MGKPIKVIDKKKKLRVGMAVFNKKLGIDEYQIREGGKIIYREPVDEMNARHKEEVGDWQATKMRDAAQAILQAKKS